jgi:methyltransferase
VVTRFLFTALVCLVALQRLIEVGISRRHERALRARGAIESAASQMPIMATLHGAWLLSMVIEVWWRQPPFRLWLAVLSLAVFLIGQSLRLAAMHALGMRWTVRVLTLPSVDPIVDGIYRYLRHPNYLGVALEIASLPLVHGAIWSALVGSLANAWMLSARIRAEEAALDSRFVPAARGPRGAQ